MILSLENSRNSDTSASLDCSMYEDRDAILGEYHKAVRREIERMKKSHE